MKLLSHLSIIQIIILFHFHKYIQREAVIGGLEPGTETEFQIFSGCGGQFETEGSTLLSVTTLKAPCDLTVDEMTATSGNLDRPAFPSYFPFIYIESPDTDESILSPSIFIDASLIKLNNRKKYKMRCVECSTRSVSLEWSGVPTATRYRVQYTLLAERGTLRQNIRPRLVTDECEQPMAVITNLLSLATYRFEVFSGTSTNFESEGTSVEVHSIRSEKS